MSELKTREPSPELRRRRSIISEEFFKDQVESILTENSYNSIQFISVDRLISFKNQRRSYFDDDKIKTLADTIREHGIRQPLTIIQSDEDPVKFEIVSGERRYLAAKMIGLEKVPCIIIHNKKAAEEIAIIENVQRVDLHPIELGKAYKGLLDNGIVNSRTDLASKIGVPRTQVSEYINFAKLPDSIIFDLVSNDIRSRSILRKLAKCSDIDEMNQIVLKALGVQDGERKKTVLKFSLSNQSIESTFNDKLKLSKTEFQNLKAKLEDVLKFINEEIEKL
ncbi:MAG: ParB/RepB/Spo0J family partition protein [Alphaproteobacteria bacterium]|nr:ParB/RepB/Spo0J family partition protein [Alphaproteobacteria bacterium]